MNKTNDIRKMIIETSYAKQSIHIAPSLSIVQILSILYSKIINSNEQFILSKGHGRLACYATLCAYGLLTKDQLSTYNDDGNNLLKQHDSRLVRQVNLYSMSMGHGASIACGIALSEKIRNTNKRVYTLVGDGQCQQGVTWEMAFFASKEHLSNLIVIVDKNNLQALCKTMDNNLLTNKWKAFGWDVVEIDGHNLEEIESALNFKNNNPLCIIANTIKGKGIEFMENKKQWHYKKLSQQQFLQAMECLSVV